MNRITRRMLSGGLVAGLTILAASAHAQARSGKWTLNAPEGEWWMTGRDYSNQRFSPLAQINTSNVANLKAASRPARCAAMRATPWSSAT